MANIMVQWLIMASMAIVHPFFVSVIDIKHNAKEATAEVSIRIFTDDLEKTIQKNSNFNIDLVHPENKTIIDKKLNEYIKNHLQLKINNSPVSGNYLGYEIVKESVWIYFEVSGIKELNKLDVNCSLLYDFETSQINIFHVKSKGNEKSFKLDYPSKTFNMTF